MECKEYSLIAVKPETYKARKTHAVSQIIEDNGFTIIAEKMVYPTKEQAKDHYNKDEEWFKKIGKGDANAGRQIYEKMIDEMVEKPFKLMILSGKNAIENTRKMVGVTEASNAAFNTIRYNLFPEESYELANKENRPLRNGVHCADSKESANREIKLWFTEEELVSYGMVFLIYD